MNIAATALLAICFALGANDTPVYTVGGQVLYPDGQPVEGAQVWLVGEHFARGTLSGADGAFRFPETPAGQATVIAYREPHALAGESLLVVGDTLTELWLGPAELTPLRIVTPQLEALTGARLLRLVVNDRFEVPAGDLGPLGFPSIRSGANGRIAIPFIPAQGYARIEIGHRKYASEVLPTLPAGTSVEVVLPYGELLRGRVIGPGKAGIQNARVAVYSSDQDSRYIFARAATGPEGFYSVLVAPGDYSITASHRGYTLPDSVRIEVRRGAEAQADDVQFAPAAWATGYASDSEGRPVPRVRVRYIQNRIARSHGISDLNGRYDLPVNLGEGWLSFEAPAGFAVVGALTAQLKIHSAVAIDLPPLKLARFSALTGRVVADGVDDMSKVIVSTTSLERNAFTRADDDGNFVLELGRFPRDGAVTIRAEHALRFLRGEITLDLTKPESIEIALEAFRPDLAPAPDWAPNKLNDLIGGPAPALECDRWYNLAESQTPPALSELRGSIVVLTLWGIIDRTDQGLERLDELRILREVFAEDSGVVILGVHEGTTPPEDIEAFLNEADLGFPVGRDVETFTTFDRYHTRFIPQTVLIGRGGAVRYVYVNGRLPELIKDLRRR